jgi:AraC-like DNA-binding protein
MTIAARLLRESDLKLAAVTDRVGYQSEFAFAKALKRDYGVAPAPTAASPPEKPRTADGRAASAAIPVMTPKARHRDLVGRRLSGERDAL